jgi:hypothetical protein
MPLIDAANTYTLKIKHSEVNPVETRENIENCTSARIQNSDPSKYSPKKKK